MENINKSDSIDIYVKDHEYIANRYVMKCYTVTMLVYVAAFVLNLLRVFVIEHKLMLCAFIPSVLIYIFVVIITKKVSLSDKKVKYFILFNIMLMFTVTGVFLTYHVVLVPILPFLYATLYSHKPIMRYVYVLTVFSTIIIVYVGYYIGLCDANMTLLTNGTIGDCVSEGKFLLTEINKSPHINLMIFFVIPRCLIYVAFMAICSSIVNIVSDSLEKAKLTEELEKAKTEAENANRAKTEFLIKMSHEIRTPINVIMGTNEMIIRESNEENILEYATDVKSSSEELLGLVNEIMDSSKSNIETNVKEDRIDDVEENGCVTFLAPGARVLIVDDNEMNIKVLSKLLKRTQMQVSGAESGKECLNILRSQSFDLIFLDHMMPEMDGIETLHAIKENKLCENVPIIMLTANALPGEREKCLKEGFDDFISKPIIPEKLDKVIIKHLSESLIKISEKEEIQKEDDTMNFKTPELNELSKKLPEINFEMGLLTCSDDEEFYLELLHDFTKLPFKIELEKYLSENDCKNYCIRIHGFKNNAYSIGAKHLGDLAYEMEKITKQDIFGEVSILQKDLFKKYDNICLKYNEVINNRGGEVNA